MRYAIVILLTAVPWLRAAEQPVVRIVSAKVPATVFPDAETEYRFRVESTRELRGRVAWRFAVGRAAVAAKELELDVGPKRPSVVAFKLPSPKVRDGVVLTGRLTVTVFEAGADASVATLETDVSILPTNPFVGRREWLKSLRITLHDPDGATAKVLTSLDVPFDEQPNAAALGDLTSGMLIVGEGASFKSEPSLAETLAELPARGVRVLILAPAEGEVMLPDSKLLSGLEFHRDLMVRMDKRLDPNAWTKPVRPVAIASGPGGWPWIEARGNRGRWAALGYPIVASWDDGPTPRYFLARLLERLADSPEKLSKKGE